MSRRRRLVELLLLACGLSVVGAAWALKSDKTQPINIRADHADFKTDPNNNSNGTGIYTGHVVITQGSIVLTSDKAVLQVVNNDLASADITGNPATFVQQPDQGEPMHGEALEITYDAATSEVVLITQAKLSQEVAPASTRAALNAASGEYYHPVPGIRLMTADRIRYNTNTQHVVAKAGDEEQRVHLTFPPKPAQTPAKTPRARGGAKRNDSPAAPTRLAPPAVATQAAPAAATQAGKP